MSNMLLTLGCIAGLICQGPFGREWNPPAWYDHPYSGELTVIQLPQPDVVVACRELLRGLPNVRVTPKQRGCARTYDNRARCVVILIDRTFETSRPRVVLRHEIGHCNGWGSDHSTTRGKPDV